MKKSFGRVFLISNLMALLLLPQLALAAPLTGADSDVGIYWHEWVGPGFTNDTTDANDSDSSGDVMWPAGNPQTKTAYIGHLTSTFTKVVVDVSGTTGTTGQDLTMEYWNGTAWANLTLDSQTHPFDTIAVNSFSFAAPEDWAQKTINGVNAYYIRTKQDGFLAATGFIGAQVSQISLLLSAAGGGEGVPELSDLLALTTLIAASWYAYTKIYKNGSTASAA